MTEMKTEQWINIYKCYKEICITTFPFASSRCCLYLLEAQFIYVNILEDTFNARKVRLGYVL